MDGLTGEHLMSRSFKLSARGDNYDAAVVTDVGTVRVNNEDACVLWGDGKGEVLVAVADGIGGYEGGEIASRLAVEITLESYRDAPASWGPARRLLRAVQRANIEIRNRALVVPELSRMGTTLTAAVISNGTLFAAHVGDCRLYIVRQSKLTQLSRDHTVVADWIRAGIVRREFAANHPQRSVLSRAIGQELIVAIDRITMPLKSDDVVLICSDGLYSVISEEELKEISARSPVEAACETLIDEANRRGTADNLTVAIVRFFGDTPHLPGGPFERVRSWFCALTGIGRR